MIDDGLSDAERLARAMKRKRTARGMANARAAAKAKVGHIPPKLAEMGRKIFEDDPPW